MAKISLVQQFEANIKSIGEVATIGKVRRKKNRIGHMEYQGDVVFAGHPDNSFSVYWDTESNWYNVYRNEILSHDDGFVSHRCELFSPEYHKAGELEAVREFITAHWDSKNPNW